MSPTDRSAFVDLGTENGGRRRAGARLAIAASLIACAYSLAGCATSQQSFGGVAVGVSERNEQRYRAAEAGLRARGYSFVDDEQLYATLDEEARQRCLDAVYQAASRAPVDETPTSTGEPMLVRVAPASRADRLPPVATELRVDGDACPFFRRQTNQLDGRKPDGSTARIVRIEDDLRLARDRSGQLVVVAVSTRVLSRRSVLVERSCDHMPRLAPDPLERYLDTKVVFGSAPPPRVEMTVEAEVLDVKCTENSY